MEFASGSDDAPGQRDRKGAASAEAMRGKSPTSALPVQFGVAAWKDGQAYQAAGCSASRLTRDSWIIAGGSPRRPAPSLRSDWGKPVLKPGPHRYSSMRRLEEAGDLWLVRPAPFKWGMSLAGPHRNSVLAGSEGYSPGEAISWGGKPQRGRLLPPSNKATRRA